MYIKIPTFVYSLFPSLVFRKENNSNNIWLTFDDGPSPESTPFILKILKQENISATFFLIGEQINKYPELFSQIIADGHEVANHSYSHKCGWTSNNTNYFSDIERCQKLIPKNKLFRPPYGKISFTQTMILKKKYKIILWDVFSWDFKLNLSPKRIEKNVLKNTTSGSILVFHNNSKSLKNLQASLQKIIKELKLKGFLFSSTW